MDRSGPMRSYYWPSRITAALVVLLPASLYKVDYRGQVGHGLSVATNKSSPAYAAFEDLHEKFSSPSIPFPKQMEVLASGQKFKPNPVMEKLSVRTLAMKGLVVRSSTGLDPEPFYVAGERLTHDHRGQLLPLHERKQILARQAEAVREEFAPPTVAVTARNLVRQEINERGPSVASDRRVMRSVTGNPIVVARAEPPYEPGSTPASPEKPSEENNPTASFSYIQTVSPVAATKDQERALWLNGQIEMTGGLAFIGADQQALVVRREVDGIPLEKGRIWVNEGRFEIHVKSATGVLIAELMAKNGRVIGRGEVNLVKIKDIPTHDNRIYDLRIALRPTTDGASLRAISGYSHGQQVLPVREARMEIERFTEPQKVNDEGFFSEPSLHQSSSFVARASAPKHWSTLVVGQAEQPQEVRLFANSLVEALIGLQASNGTDRREAELASVVWGQVRREGKPEAGVTVEMAGSYKAIYFNDLYLPDEKLTATGANGLFAFVNVKRGVQALRVTSRGRVYPAQVFPTENKFVSYVQVSLEDRVISEFKIMDALNLKAPLEARVRLVGTNDPVPIHTKGMLEYSNGANPFMVEADAGIEYEVSRVTLTGRPQSVMIPMVRHDWLTKMFNDNNVMALPGRGIIVGYIDDQDYEVELTGYGPKEPMNVVYFDAQGQQIKGRAGVAGGGFIIFNAPLGLQTLYVHAAQSKDTYAQVVVAEPEYVHVMTWSANH